MGSSCCFPRSAATPFVSYPAGSAHAAAALLVDVDVLGLGEVVSGLTDRCSSVQETPMVRGVLSTIKSGEMVWVDARPNSAKVVNVVPLRDRPAHALEHDSMHQEHSLPSADPHADLTVCAAGVDENPAVAAVGYDYPVQDPLKWRPRLRTLRALLW